MSAAHLRYKFFQTRALFQREVCVRIVFPRKWRTREVGQQPPPHFRHVLPACVAHCITRSRACPVTHSALRNRRIQYADVLVHNVSAGQVGSCGAGNLFILRSSHSVVSYAPTTSVTGQARPLRRGSRPRNKSTKDAAESPDPLVPLGSVTPPPLSPTIHFSGLHLPR